jgi:hypothetical protein
MGDYPTDQELRKVMKWDTTKDLKGLIVFLKEIWWTPEWGFVPRGNKLELHTAGWSGNESIIEFLQQNRMFWMMCWEQTRRGGHYLFDLKTNCFQFWKPRKAKRK